MSGRVRMGDIDKLRAIAADLDAPVESPEQVVEATAAVDRLADFFGVGGSRSVPVGGDRGADAVLPAAAAVGAARALAREAVEVLEHLAPLRGPESGQYDAVADAARAHADALDAGAARVLAAIGSTAIPVAAGSTIAAAVAAGAEHGVPDPAPPPSGADAVAVNAYWTTLISAQQERLLTRHPDWLGNLDGVPAPVRHAANRARLDGIGDHLQRVRAELAERLSRRRTRGWFTNLDAGIGQVDRKIADVERLRELMAERAWTPANPTGRMLLQVDMDSGEQGKSVLAIGNPDDSDHVGIVAPGMDTNIRDSFRGMSGEAWALRAEALRQLHLAQVPDPSVSIVAWLGYEPPNNDSTRVRWWTYLEVLQQDRATNGAPDLVRFYRGLAATSTRERPHLVALGHSYGSLTQGLALKQPGGHPIGAAAFYGSPGFEARTERQLGLSPGHGFVMMADRDWIAHARSRGPFGLNGPAPRHTDLVQLYCSVPRTTPDGVFREAAHTHADYPRTGDNGELRVSGYLLARIVAGLDPNP